jgi:hypothetical protein
MHEDNRSGNVTGTIDQLCRAGRTTAAVLVQALSELSRSGTAQVNERDGIFSVTNRRMSRERRTREYERLRKQDQRVREKSRNCPGPSSISVSISRERPPDGALSQPERRSGQTAPEDPRGAKTTSERESKSAFSLKECEQYAASLKSIKSPKAYAKTIWRSGEDDDAIAAYLAKGDSGNAAKKPPDRPVDVAEVKRLAAEFEAMDPPRTDIADALRASIGAK